MHVWYKNAGALYVISVRPFVFYPVIEQEFTEVYIIFPFLIGANVQDWVVYTFDARQDSIYSVAMFNSNNPNINIIYNIHIK